MVPLARTNPYRERKRDPINMQANSEAKACTRTRGRLCRRLHWGPPPEAASCINCMHMGEQRISNSDILADISRRLLGLVVKARRAAPQEELPRVRISRGAIRLARLLGSPR